MTTITATSALLWKYKGEGACNIVLSYIGKDEQLVGKVLRLRKYGTGGDEYADLKNHDFINNVMLPLIGSKYVYPGTIVELNREFLLELDKLIFNDRPAHRRHNPLNVDSKRGLLILDLTLVNTENSNSSSISVEIKPKCGFINKSKYLSVHTNNIKSHTCRYCMHQYLKLKEGSIHSISQYCPLDLFSGDVNRIKKAIKSLIECPQNNLKIYKDGELFYTGTLGGKEDHSVSTLTTLFKDGNSSDAVPSVEEIETQLTNYLSSILQREHQVLENLLVAQKYDTLDIEAIYYLYCLQLKRQRDQLLVELLQIETSSSSLLTNEKELLQEKINSIGVELARLPPNYEDGDRMESLNQMSSDKIEEIIERFLVATTAKDCSIMITFNTNTIDVNQQLPSQYRVGIVDLDAKKRSSIPSYFKNDKLIIDTYKNNNNNISHCKE